MHAGGTPPVGPRLAESVDEGHQAAAAEDHAQHVQPDAGAAPAVRDHGERAQKATSAGDGQVHVEAPAPVDVLGQEAAEDQPEGGARDGDRGIDAEGPAPFPRIGEGRRSAMESTDGASRAPNSPWSPRAPISMSVVWAAPPMAEASGEADDAGHQRPLRPEHVADAAAEQQEPAEGQRVGGHHPLPVGVGEAQRVLGRRQGDDHDGGVEHHHQLCPGDDDEDPPVGPRGTFRRRARASTRAGVAQGRHRQPHPIGSGPAANAGGARIRSTRLRVSGRWPSEASVGRMPAIRSSRCRLHASGALFRVVSTTPRIDHITRLMSVLVRSERTR